MRPALRPSVQVQREMLHSAKRSTSGFTLMELMAVVAIIGVLSTLAAGSFMKYLRASYRTEVIGDLSSISLRQRALFAVRGHFASTALGGDEDNTFPVLPTGLKTYKGGKIAWDETAAGYTAASAGTGAYFRQGPNEHGFDALNFMPEGGRSRCAYGSLAGDGTNGAIGPDVPPGEPLAREIFPAGTERFYARDWFYSFAYCDFDSDSVYWTFSTSHVSADISTGNGANWGE